MSTKLICDYCVRPIEGGYTTMAVTSLEADGTTVAEASSSFEFHGGCYNTLQGLIVQLRSAQPPPPLDPTPIDPKPQPTSEGDPPPPQPPGRPEPTPEPEPGPTPDPPPAPEPEPEPAPEPEPPQTPETPSR